MALRTSRLHITLNISANYSQLIEIKEVQWLSLPDQLYIATQPLHFALIINQDLLSHLANIDFVFFFLVGTSLSREYSSVHPNSSQ